MQAKTAPRSEALSSLQLSSVAGTLAIDLGSTTTVVAYQGSGDATPALLDLAPISASEPSVVPSLIWLRDASSTQPLIGRQVIEAGLLEQGGAGLHRDFKRRIGAGCTPTSEAEPYEGWLSPEQSGQLLLEQIWQRLPDHVRPQRLVLTAPIDSYRGYRQWLLEATSQLEVPEIALVDEPTAAAIGAGLPPGSRVLVIDVGGGTTGMSILKSGKVTFSADEPTGGSHMTLVLAGALGLPYAEAEAMKKDPAQEAQVFTLVLPVAQKMASLVSGWLATQRVRNLYLVGGASSFSKFAEVFSKETGRNVIPSVEPLLVTPLGIAMNAGRR